MSSKPVSAAPKPERARDSTSTAWSIVSSLQRGGRDDAQRSLAADIQVAQVIAGVVLAQAAQAVPDFAFRGHHFQAQRQVARVAVAQHLGAAGVGGQVAANRAAAFGRKAERKHPLRP
ncbi:hypothetical protein G6F65_020701 [Rhizopus arrhizus]|nr:hypothetical protein G6F65_020701 [Rhizopus arrhizus]